MATTFPQVTVSLIRMKLAVINSETLQILLIMWVIKSLWMHEMCLVRQASNKVLISLKYQSDF